MQRVTEGVIELVGIFGGEHHADRSSLSVQLRLWPNSALHLFVEASVRQRVRNRHADVVRTGEPYQSDRLLNVSPGLSGIAKLQEVAGANACILQPQPRVDDFGDH